MLSCASSTCDVSTSSSYVFDVLACVMAYALTHFIIRRTRAMSTRIPRARVASSHEVA